MAIKIAYNGQNYQGFATNYNEDNTIEGELFKALKKAKFIQEIEKSDYSRAGRTDKGVSALGNVIALNLRICANSNNQQQQQFYEKALNNLLPSNIRIVGISEVDSSFNARYHCTMREYHYFFPQNILNIPLMSESCKKFLGVHDFRNFSKLNLKNSIDHQREICDIKIERIHDNIDPRFELYVLKVKGRSFLQHQIRNMMFILFQIGNQLEPATIIDDLFDIDKQPKKPQYQMAPPQQLTLQNCYFDNIQFELNQNVKINLYEEIQQKIFQINIENIFYKNMLTTLSQNNDNLEQLASNEQQKNKSIKKNKYKSILTLQCGPSVDELIATMTEEDRNQYNEKLKKLKFYQEKND